MIKLANYIRYIRLEKGLSQEKMAINLNISVTAYSKIERGLTNISFSRLEQIAATLGVTMTSLVEFYENGNSDRSTYPEQFTEATHKSSILFMKTRIMELEENIRILRQAINDMRSIMEGRNRSMRK